MNTIEETIVLLSKKKILLLILVSCAVVVLGGWLLSMDDTTIQSHRRSPIFVHSIGFLAITLFGLTGAFGIKKFFDKKPGLIFNRTGIVDNSSGVSAGLIPWSEIDGAEIFEMHKQMMLIIKVRDPQKYIVRGGRLKQMLNKANYKMCGSPIAVTSNTLKISFEELLSLFKQYQQKYGDA